MSSHFAFARYDPWGYSSAAWLFGPAGYWYGPYGPRPYVGFFGYDPYWYGAPGNSSYAVYEGFPSRTERREPESAPTGALRLRVSPKNAKVYIDGALAGTVDDFDGLAGHLTIEAGTHQLEFRADGYQPFSSEVTVQADKTRTERASLKKK
ncbi:MAG: PEGA domain-containing protein [Vicinamibacterales bacterium]